MNLTLANWSLAAPELLLAAGNLQLRQLIRRGDTRRGADLIKPAVENIQLFANFPQKGNCARKKTQLFKTVNLKSVRWLVNERSVAVDEKNFFLGHF